MITKTIKVNGTEFRLTLTDQVISQVNNLKNLYNAAYEDPESFEEVSAEISSTINEIATAADPEASDGDLDGLIQEIIKVVDNKAAEIEKELEGKPEKTPTKKSKSKK
jgi:chloramphenicol O-acetyltransferase